MNFELMWDSLPRLIGATWLTLQLVGLSLLLAFFAGIGVALVRLYAHPAFRGIAYAYVFVMRGTPLIVQIALIYYGLGQFEFVRDSFAWEVLREPYWCAIIALTLNSAAYSSEIVRGGIQSVPKGHVEAARACGMSWGMAFRRIVFPAAMRQALPGYSNEIILMVKASSLASTITLMELTGAANRIVSQTYAVVEIFLIAGAIYLAINFVVSRGVDVVEKRLTPHLRART